VKRIAFLGRGGHTLPSHRALLNKLAEGFTIILYSEVVVQPEWLKLEHRYEIKCFKGMGLPRLLREPIFVFMLLIEHLRKPFDLTHSHSTYPTGLAAILLQKIFKIPALISLDGGEGIYISEAKFGDFNSRKRTLLNKWVINQAMGITALTNFQKDKVVLNLSIKRRIEVITRGVDNRKFEFIENRVFGSSITFLSVGYLSPIKNPEMLIKTLIT
jgi:glycosyltransferase involved in cell wall biosynthesis